MKRWDLRDRGPVWQRLKKGGGPKRKGGTMSETMPVTAKEALDLWDAGKDVQAFQVEAKPERQNDVYSVAFMMIRLGKVPDNVSNLNVKALEELLDLTGGRKLSEREFHVAHSIAFVALQSGWAKMVSQHVHRDSPAITIRKQTK